MSPQNAIAGAPGLLFQVVEWGVVPGAMLWLAFRWVLWGPAREGGLRARSKRDREAARDATVAGLLVAVSAFLVFYATCHPAPVGAEPPIGQTLALSWESGSLFLAGLLIVAVQRSFWRKLAANNMAQWLRRNELVLTTAVACCLGIFSLICYFEWREAHGPLFLAFSGLLIGYRALKAMEHFS
jgi:hypothetical protein